MTVTTKTTTHWSNASKTNWGKRFGKKAAQDLAAYKTSYNMETQALAFADENPSTTGTKPIMIDGVFIPSLTAEADADWSETTEATKVEGNAKGVVIANLYSRWLIVFANAAGMLRIDTAGAAALDGNEVLKIPDWDPSVWTPIALVDVNSTGVTLGTTDINAMVTIVQITGPVFPHPDNFDAN